MIKKWAERLPSAPLTRFAPSPGGWLHLGHVLSAMYVWGLGRAVGARIILRIEDHDLSRARPEYEQGILDTLSWLGLPADDGVTKVGTPSHHRQSDHLENYADTIKDLSARQLVYACECSRKEIMERTQQNGGELLYDDFCRDRGLAFEPYHGIRLRLDAKPFPFDDGLHGRQQHTPAQQCGDLLLKDKHGHYSYNFAVTCDDLRDGVNLIIRGEDLLHATGRQLQLREILGHTKAPHFFHHPLIKDGTRKLSKRDGALGIEQLRQEGKTPAEIWRQATTLAGLPACDNIDAATSHFEGLLRS